MSILIDKDIQFDGEWLDKLGWELYPVNLSFSREDSLGIRKNITYNGDAFVSSNAERFIIDATFARIRNGIPTEITDRILEDLNKLFFKKNETVVMAIGGKQYYVNVISGSLVKLQNGYITITMESVSPYAWSLPRSNYYKSIKDVRDISITNCGIIDTYLDLEIKGKADKIIVRNKINGNNITFNYFNNDIRIEGDTLEVFGMDYTNIEGNIKDTLLLKTGANRYSIEVIGGDIELQFRFQECFGLM